MTDTMVTLAKLAAEAGLTENNMKRALLRAGFHPSYVKVNGRSVLAVPRGDADRFLDAHTDPTVAVKGQTAAANGKSPAPPAEPPVQNLRKRFRPLAEGRTSKVLEALDYLGQLSQRARYRYTDAEVEIIEAAILDKLTKTMAAFRKGTGNRPAFKFDPTRPEEIEEEEPQ